MPALQNQKVEIVSPGVRLKEVVASSHHLPKTLSSLSIYHLLTTPVLDLFQTGKWKVIAWLYQNYTSGTFHVIFVFLSMFLQYLFYTHSETAFLALWASGGGTGEVVPVCNLSCPHGEHNSLGNRLGEYLEQCMLQAEVLNTPHLLTDSKNYTVGVSKFVYLSKCWLFDGQKKLT